MPRQSRVDKAGEIYHVINRSNARMTIFKRAGDFQSVISTLEEVLEESPLEIFAFCIMPNHWHFAVRPKNDGDMGRFFGKFTQRVTQRWHAYNRTAGTGHLFQGRFKSFLVQQDSYFIQLVRYIEANALRASLVKKAEEWPSCSLFLRLNNKDLSKIILSPWPVQYPKNYLKLVNDQLPKHVKDAISNSLIRCSPLGDDSWAIKKAAEFNLGYTLRNPGRPKKK